MFCYKCEQTAGGTGCEKIGVCGKTPDTSALHDVIVKQVKDIAIHAWEAAKKGKLSKSINNYVIDALFTTVTNVNFDNQVLFKLLKKGQGIQAEAKALFTSVAGANAALPQADSFEVAGTLEGAIEQSKQYSLAKDSEDVNIRSLMHILLYGVMGMAAYVHHAARLGKEDESVYSFILEAMAQLNNPHNSADTFLGLCMRCGEVNIRAMELLDNGHVERFGHPEPTPVSTALKAGPAIVVSGHDLIDLEDLLKQTEGKGINIYTHGEMLPAHGYPGLKKYSHLAGHFGTAWQNQQKEFDKIEAAVLFNTNCIQKPRESYMDRVFTTGLVGWPGAQYVANGDFSPVIKKALSLKGFKETAGGSLLTGFGRNAVLSVADKVIGAVKSGAIKHFYLVGGCDGAKPGRNYYTEVVEKAPADSVVLTLACGKFRFNHMDLGDIGGIPRLLDIGQCNDAYSALKIAMALAEAFNCSVNDLPLTMILSWYEQKAVVILLSLLSLGIQGIKLGPTLPAFVSSDVLNILVEKFNIAPISTPEKDLKLASFKN